MDIRDSFLGQVIRSINERLLPYPEDEEAFTSLKRCCRDDSSTSSTNSLQVLFKGADEKKQVLHATESLGWRSVIIENDTFVEVDWYQDDDQANPQNWRPWKKGLTTSIICIYTTVVYAASSIYVNSEYGVMSAFGVSKQEAILPLSMFVLSYGLGPLVFAPLSEISSIGRNRVYAWTFNIFTLLSVALAFVQNFSGLVVLRFLTAFFGSPCLANGGASIQDVYSEETLPYGMMVWVAATYVGPSVAPLLSGVAVARGGWNWSLKEILLLSIPACIMINVFLPETSARAILKRRAQRLRKVTGCDRFRSSCEIRHHHLAPREILRQALIKPIEISIRDSSVAFTVVYTSLIYGTYYTYFECLPLVYEPIYGFNLVQCSAVFLCITIACAIGCIIYSAYVYYGLNPFIARNGPQAHEYMLRPALAACFFPPAGLFVFGWSAQASIPWILSVLGIALYSVGVFIMLQVICIYISRAYPRYAASLFAANECVRSVLAASAIHFAKPLYRNLGVARGISVLAGLSTLGIVGIFYIYRYGRRMREQSRFAASP